MLSLVIETATRKSIIALVSKKSVLFSTLFGAEGRDFCFLIPKVKEGLKKIEASLQDVDFITVGVGPGSYTGIRVGVSVGRGLAYGAKIPLIGVSTLKGFIPKQDGSFATLLDAKSRGVVVRCGERKGNKIFEKRKCYLCKGDELQSSLLDMEQIITPEKDVIEKKLKEIAIAEKIVQEVSPSPLFLKNEAEEIFKKGSLPSSSQLELIYFY